MTGPVESENVVGEIRGREKPDEFVLLGAHLDSWDLGTGALDNGCNAAMVIDAARVIHASGNVPAAVDPLCAFHRRGRGRARLTCLRARAPRGTRPHGRGDYL